ncbi:uncharacterized protein LOC131432281 [Malaya genurostris]|uniref:uncharacterized protein LOC131432281 n=1 Tax=Malaya genurostris TaxID=325434 RepID=UPI0026F403BC|nr:uncharacterized protein LOC131432281 [Malaya genurostris]
MISFKVLLLSLLTVILTKPTTQLPKDPLPAVVQPPETITDSKENNTQPNDNTKSSESLAEEIRSKATGSEQNKTDVAKTLIQLGINTNKSNNASDPKEQTLKEVRDQILQSANEEESLLQQLRESDLLNAFHEAIDNNIIDPSFIETLASVEEPPLITNYTRDTLLIKSIREDANFTFGDHVFSWKTLKQSNKSGHVVVGLSEKSIVILCEVSGEFLLQQEIPMETVPTAFEVTTVWDATEETSVSCLVVATEMVLIWYTMRARTNFALEEEWRWPLHKMTTLIKFMRHRDVDMMLLVGNHPNKLKTVSATLYEFNFLRQQFWLMQKLILQFPCKSIGLVNVGNEFLIAFPQNNTAMIYTFEVGKDYRSKFNLTANFSSEQVNSVQAFQVGRFAYIAIGGKSPQILRYSNGNFTSQSVPTEALETVEAFFEIPTRTYRDDLILLVQHRLAFSTHEIQRLEVLVWNGESFDIRSNIPCYVEDEPIDFEVSCMLDLHQPTGIAGSTIIQREKLVSMIIPRYKAHSSLFHIEISMLSGENPITKKVQEIHDTIDAFTKILAYQDTVIKEAMDRIAAAENLQSELLLEDCKLESVEAEAVYLNDVRWPDDMITIGDVPWTYEDSTVDIAAIVREMEYEEARLLELEQELRTTIRRNDHSFPIDMNQPLYVEGRLEVMGSLVTDNLYVDRLEDGPVPSLQQMETLEELHVEDLQVRHLNFEKFNGIPASELVFNLEDKIVLDNKIIFENTVVAENVILPEGGTVNGIDLSESIVYFNDENRVWKNLAFDQLEVSGDVIVNDLINGRKFDMEEINTKLHEMASQPTDVLTADTLVLNGSLNFKTINGMPWNEIVQNIILKNNLNGTVKLNIEGNLILEHPNISVSHLNELAFPDDYLLSNAPTVSIVTGHKRFINTTYVNTLDVGETVNGIDLKQIITLHDDQHIPGNVTIGELHVLDQLDIRGTIKGDQLDQLLHSPTLLEAKHIKAGCHFRKLVVDGPVIIEEVDGKNLDEMLSDVVYDTERNVEIVGQKRFNSVEFLNGVTIQSGMINDVKLDSFITRSTEQTLSVEEISGDIFFKNLTLDGLFFGLNATRLDKESIKLFGDQHTEATLVFENPPDSSRPDIEANELRIGKMLNSKTRSEYLDSDQDELIFSGNLTLPHWNVDTLHLIASSIDGPSKMINNVHLPTFDSVRFSLTRPQQIDVPFYIDKLTVTKEAYALFINGVDVRYLKKNMQTIRNLKNNVLDEDIYIENLFIEGDLKVNMLNGINFDQLLDDVIWLNRPNRIPGTVIFEDPLYFGGDLTVLGLVNQVNFTEFLEDVVLKSDEVVEFFAPMIFENGLVVEGNLDTPRINDICVKDLILKNQTVFLSGDVEIVGTLYVEHLLVGDRFNGQPIQDLLQMYEYDATRDVHVIKNDMYFGNVSIESLDISGGFNEIPNIEHHLSSLIRKNQDYNFTEPIVFKKEVIFERGLFIDVLDGMDVSNLQHEIFLTDQETPVEFHGDVVILGPTYIETLTVGGDLITPNINGFDPDFLLKNAVMINEDAKFHGRTIFAPGTFDTQHIRADYINGLPVNKLITLNTDQAIDGTLYVEKLTITQPLEVGGLINGISFPLERENTLMTYGTQNNRPPTVPDSTQVKKSFGEPVEKKLQDFQSELRSVCSRTHDLLNKTKSRVYFFNYFVQRQVIDEHKAIKSFYFFDHIGYHFLAVNFECISHFYQWDPTGEMFVRLYEFHTGPVREWKTVIISDLAIFLVTLSSNEGTTCQSYGVNVWLFTGEQLKRTWHTVESLPIQAIGCDPHKSESFFVLKKNQMTEYNVNGKILVQWKLPDSRLDYRFLPHEAGLGLALSNGTHLVLLSTLNKSKATSRTKRNNRETVGMALFSSQAMYDRMHRNYSSQSTRHSRDKSWIITDMFQPDFVIEKEPHTSFDVLPYHKTTLNHSTSAESSFVEAKQSREMLRDGIETTENKRFSGRINGDIVAFRVGPSNMTRHLVAVSTVVDNVIEGSHDAIKIYLDILNGQLYQVLRCREPSGLSVLELRDETILAFIESRQTVQIYTYQDVAGFVPTSSFRLTASAIQMTGISLPLPNQFMCPVHYLAIATEQQKLALLKAKTQGNCGLEVDLDCDFEN